MLQSGVYPNGYCYTAVIRACSKEETFGIGEVVFGSVLKTGHMAADVCVGCGLIDMFVKGAQNLDDAYKVFDKMPDRNVVTWTLMITRFHQLGSLAESRKVFSRMQDHNVMSWTAIITGYVQQNGGDDMEAIELFIEMMQDGRIKPNEFTLAAVIKACAGLSNSQIGEEVYCYAVKVGLASINCVGNSVISMYAKCGRTENARKAFDVLFEKNRNVISWTSMVTGFAKHGLATRALETFGDMLEAGVKPNDVTYIAVLSACSHAGLVSEGCQHFESMKSKHGIVPRMEHYACIVDLFGRAGRLTEAMYFIDAMPFKPNPLVLRTFLGACQVHGNTNLGKRAADMILDQDPDDPSAYVLLSNLYAAAGQWEEVTEIRKQMKERNLTKEAGCSWIETDNVVHKFHVGDTTHRRAFDIFEELKQLGEEIKELGYVPNTEFVLHDVGEEEKEMYLLQHSERIAVAFGFISSAGSSKPVRVFKNLRICGDCHSAFKYFSVVRDREIVVRDSNRFHHFRNGTCSCNDYW
ncbi:Pentatricopeptide repeat-containing protein At3g49170, chloroplastic [Linum grandiflorum]